MNEVWEGAAHKLKPIVSGITLSPSTSEIRSRTQTRTRYTEIIFYILDLGILAIGLRVLTVYSNSHSQNLTHFIIIMTTRTITGRSTRNSRNAGSVPGISFGRTIPPRVSTPR